MTVDEKKRLQDLYDSLSLWDLLSLAVMVTEKYGLRIVPEDQVRSDHGS